MTLKPGCVTCEHVADVRGIDLTQPTPEAVEAVALHLIRDEVFMRPQTSKQVAADVLPFIRDAIHRDGPDADAIRETLGLIRDKRWDEGARRWVNRPVGQWRQVQP